MSLTASQRKSRASLAGLSRVAKHGGFETTAPGRRAFDRKFLDQVDPERLLPEAERALRAKAARSAYFTRLALASSIARGKKAAAKKAAAA